MYLTFLPLLIIMIFKRILLIIAAILKLSMFYQYINIFLYFRFKESSREAVLRRLVKPVLEEENYQPDHASLNLVQEPQDLLGRRGICVSTIFR